jgi:short-subunit dehydrogenase
MCPAAREPPRHGTTDMKKRTTALVTGATSGIGRAFAERLARDGHDLVLTGRRRIELRRLASDIRHSTGVRVTPLIVELSREKDVAALVRRIRSLEGLDVLVSNAGYGIGLHFRQASVEEQLAMVGVHVSAALRIMHAALPAMVKRGSGTIIAVASLAAFLPLPKSAVYCGTKAFLNAFTQSLAMEVRKHGIRVQSLCPGLVDTDFHRRNARRQQVRNRGLIRWATAEQVVERSFRDLARGRVLCIPGFWNRIGIRLVQPGAGGAFPFMPRRLYAAAISRFGESRSGSGAARSPARENSRS